MSETNNGIEVLAATGGGQAMMAPGGGLSGGKLALADAETGDVLAGKTYYAGDKELKTGTLALANATATESDVRSGKTFFAGNGSLKTGSCELSANTTSRYLRGAGAYSTTCILTMTATKQSNGSIVVSAEAISADKEGYNPSEWHRKSSITISF